MQGEHMVVVENTPQQGHFTWEEWADTLAQELKAVTERGEVDDGSRYYDELPRWPAEDLAIFAVVNLLLFGAIGTGIYLYARGKVGPRFWTLFSFAGVLPGWASHFSPFTDQPVSYILNAYDYGVGGRLAVGVLLALMLVMTMAGVYAAALWRREVRMQRRMEGA